MSTTTTVMGWEVKDIEDAIKEAMKRSTTDSEFRHLALKDPNEAIERVAGKPLPPGTRFHFVENQNAHFTVILPDPKVGDASELSDAELEQVAGGGRCVGTCAVSCAATSTVTIGIPGVGSVLSI